MVSSIRGKGYLVCDVQLAVVHTECGTPVFLTRTMGEDQGLVDGSITSNSFISLIAHSACTFILCQIISAAIIQLVQVWWKYLTDMHLPNITS